MKQVDKISVMELDLLDATVDVWISRPGRGAEILRSREIFAEAMVGEAEDSSVEDYFMQYALAARKNR